MDFDSIKNHQWFLGIDWQALNEKKVKPPFKPRIKSPGDTRYFDDVFTKESASDSLESDILSPSPNQFSGFTYQASGPISMQEN